MRKWRTPGRSARRSFFHLLVMTLQVQTGSLFCAGAGAQSFTRQNKSSAWSRGGRWGSPHGPAWSWLPMRPWSSRWGWLKTCHCLCHGGQNHYLERDDTQTEVSGCSQLWNPSHIPDLQQRWKIIITNSHFEILLLCVITTGRAVLLVIIRAHFLLPSLGQLCWAREHVNKGHPPKRSA